MLPDYRTINNDHDIQENCVEMKEMTVEMFETNCINRPPRKNTKNSSSLSCLIETFFNSELNT